MAEQAEQDVQDRQRIARYRHDGQEWCESWDVAQLETKLEDLAQELKVAVTLAKEATNGWGIFAKRKTEHAEIARLHRGISELEKGADG